MSKKKKQQGSKGFSQNGADTVLDSLVRARVGLRDAAEQGHLGGLISAIREAEKWTADRSADRIVMDLLFDDLMPNELYNHLRARPGWRESAFRVWIEIGPIEGQGRDGLLVLKKPDEDHFCFYQVGNAPLHEVQEKHGAKLVKHLLTAEHLVNGHTSVDRAGQKVNTHLLAPCRVDLDENGLVSHHMDLKGLPVMRDMESGGEKVKAEIEAKHKAKAQRSSVYLLRLVYLMQHAGALKIQAPAPGETAAPRREGFRPFALNQGFLTRFNALKTPDELRQLLGLPTQAAREQRPIFDQFGPIKNDPRHQAEDPAQIVRNFVAEVRGVPHIICDRAFCDLTREMADVLSPQTVADLLAEQGTLFAHFWFESPYVPSLSKSGFVPRLGAVVARQKDGRALSLRMVETTPSTRKIPASQFLVVKKPKVLPDVGINFHLDAREIAFDKPIAYDEEAAARMHFLATGLLLTRAHADGLAASGVALPWEPIGKGTVRERSVSIRNPGKKRKSAIMINGKSRARLRQEEREILKLTDEALAWEAVKQAARDKHGRLLTKDNHGPLMDLLDRTAKAMFGAKGMEQYGRNVTVQLSDVRESIPIPNRVNPGDHRIPHHMRITLMWEDSPSPEIRTIRRALYRVTTHLRPDDAGALRVVMSARGRENGPVLTP